MTQQQGEIGIERLCELGRVVRASYYRWWKRARPQPADGELRDRLQRICLAHRYYGYRRVQAALRRQGFVVNHKKVRRLMREDNLLAVRKRKWLSTPIAATSWPCSRTWSPLWNRMERINCGWRI